MDSCIKQSVFKSNEIDTHTYLTKFATISIMHAFKSIHFKEILPKIFSCTPPKKETLKEGGANSGLVFK